MTALDLIGHLEKAGTRPVLTCYGPASGSVRLELSGKVLANHCIKIANFLADDLLVDEGDTIVCDLPVHWRALPWFIGAAAAGIEPLIWEGECVDCGREQPHQISSWHTVVSSNPRDWLARGKQATDIIAVSLGALDLSCTDLPAGVTDGIAGPAAMPDILLDPDRGLPCLPATLTHAGDADRYIVVDPSLPCFIDVALSLFATGKGIVVADHVNLELAQRTEGAPLLQNGQ